VASNGCKITYLLNTVLIALLQRQDLVCALLCVIDLLPGLLLFLLEKGDTVSQQLGVPLDTANQNEQGESYCQYMRCELFVSCLEMY
jgi:hypothetical protein